MEDRETHPDPRKILDSPRTRLFLIGRLQAGRRNPGLRVAKTLRRTRSRQSLR
ncbi:MAG: hypothetical protein IPL99_18150 [Candidatus Competibacteraceae bacterium]|nr:hypothetical protein [Candidatus Competibacteraceae bacterium]